MQTLPPYLARLHFAMLKCLDLAGYALGGRCVLLHFCLHRPL